MKSRILAVLLTTALVLGSINLIGTETKAASSTRTDIYQESRGGTGLYWIDKNGATGGQDGWFSFYFTGDGSVAYCLSHRKGHPDGVLYTKKDYSGFVSHFGATEAAMVNRILEAGYPLAKDYWASAGMGLTELDMRAATQLAIWHVQALQGSDSDTGPAMGTALQYSNLYPNRDVAGMVTKLVNYGLYGGNSPVTRRIDISSSSTTKSDNTMTTTFTVVTNGYSQWKGTFSGLPTGASVEVNGSTVEVSDNRFVSTKTGTITVSVTYPAVYGKTIRLTVIGEVLNKTANLFYYTPSSNAQEMILMTQNAYANGNLDNGSATTPNQAGGKVTLSKTDEAGNPVTLEAIYGLYRDMACTDLIQEISTLEGQNISSELTFGTYYLKEITPPAGYALSEQIYEVVLSADDSGSEYVTKNVLVTDAKQTGTVTIIKKDSESNGIISSPAEFDIYEVEVEQTTDPETGSVVTVPKTENDQLVGTKVGTITTGSDGKGTTNSLPIEKWYAFVETKAPEGYVLPEAYVELIHVEGDSTGAAVVVYEREILNDPQTGAVEIYKHGDQLSDFEIREDGTLLTYEDLCLPGVEFTIYAAEDIISLDAAANVLYAADQEIGKILTDSTGKAVLEDLPIGKYYAVETAGADGFILDGTKHPFEIKSGGREAVEATGEELDILNARQTVEISFNKTDEVSGSSLVGAVIGLYTGEDIETVDGRIIPAGTLIEKVTSGADGSAAFISSVLVGYEYYLQEIEAPEGWKVSDVKFKVEVSASQVELGPVSVTIKDAPYIGTIEGNHSEDKDETVTAVDTGDDSLAPLFALLAMASLAIFLYFGKKISGIKKCGSALALILATTLAMSAPALAAELHEIKETYETTDKDEKITFEDKIEVEGKKYNLQSVTYTVIKETPVILTETSITKPILVGEAYEAPETITKDGLTYTLKATERTEAPVTDRSKLFTKTETYRDRYTQPTIPQTSTLQYMDAESDKTVSAELSLTGIKNGTFQWKDDFEFNMTVTGAGLPYYEMNGKLVPYDAAAPKCEGLEADILAVLDLPGTHYRVTALEWAGEPYTDESGQIKRDINGYGERYVADYTATYSAEVSLPDAPGYIYTSTYEATPTKDNVLYTIEAAAFYEPAFETAPLLIGGGVIIGVGILVLLVVSSKKKKKEEEEAGK